jgi:hypothetical protein
LKQTGDVAKAGSDVASMAEYYDILKLEDWQTVEELYSTRGKQD